MTPYRLAAIGFIYFCATFAWFTLGWSVMARTGEFDARLEKEVALLWGGRHTQAAPSAWVERPAARVEDVTETDDQGRTVTRQVTRTVVDRVPIAYDSSRITVDLALDQRQKGLLWYDTYGVRFRAVYRLRNPDDTPRTIGVHLTFPSSEAIYDEFTFSLDGQRGTPASDLSKGVTLTASLPPQGSASVELAYASRGLGDWTYAFSGDGVASVNDFELAMTADFDRIDFPAGTISPTERRRTPQGWALTWAFERLVTGQRIGMDLPDRTNPGPLAARITFFAPVSLLFFLTVMVILGVLSGQNLHPMNYAFLSAAFFAFHLLLAYLVDHLPLHAAFGIAAAASIFLVISYLRLVAGTRFAFVQAGVAQLVFLVLFSYSFFLEGFTGLTVTIGSVVTLFVLMQVTARVDWAVVLDRRVPEARA